MNDNKLTKVNLSVSFGELINLIAEDEIEGRRKEKTREMLL